jgi:hypothetical protein
MPADDKKIIDVRVVETQQSPLSALKELIELRLRHIESAISEMKDGPDQFSRKSLVDLMMKDGQEAIAKAEIAAEKRFDSVNEFRAQLADQQANFITRQETNIRFDAVNQKLDGAIQLQQATVGRTGGFNAAWGALAVVLGLLFAGGAVAVAIAALKH